jgi:hypothetical protein
VGDSADCGHAVERRQGNLTDGSRDNTLMTRMSTWKTARGNLVELNDIELVWNHNRLCARV